MKTDKNNMIALNRKAGHRYHLGEKFEAGIALYGWEVSSLRGGRAQISDSYVVLKKGEAWLIGAVFSPLPHASGHERLDPGRSRKLLLHRQQLDRIIGAVTRRGLTCLCTRLYFKKHLVKCEIVLGKGKKLHDHREEERRRTLQREQEQAISRRIK